MDLMIILKELSQEFKAHGFKVFAVGGTVRDYLLNNDICDFDFATDARYEDMKEFLDIHVDRFKKLGSIKVKFLGESIDITTLRKENNYLDRRHPSRVEFVKSIEEDYKRRDFTINSLYLDEFGTVYDFCGGQDDLKNKTIRAIGNANKRIMEDPLRIIRAIRFKKTLGFEFSCDLERAMKINRNLLKNINQDKILEESHKMKMTLEDLNVLLKTSLGSLDY